MAKDTFGNVIKAVVSPGTPVTVAGIVSIDNLPQLTRQMLDSTEIDQASQAESVIPAGTYKVSEVQLTIHHEDQNTPDALFYSALTGKTLLDLQHVFKKSSGTSTWSYSGYVSAYGPGPVTKDGKQTMRISIMPSTGITKA